MLGDLLLYLASAVFAGYTAAASTLAPHRAWGGLALPGYLLATVAVLGQLAARPTRAGRWLTDIRARAWVTGSAWPATALVPLVIEAVQRAAGRTDRAQEEVIVVEGAGQRLLDHGTPYLSRHLIEALPADDRLLGYLPYQPGMALFGLPRAVAGPVWWTDARVWFAVVTALTLCGAIVAVRGRPTAPPDQAAPDRRSLLRAVQLTTVLPLSALTLATGGDDLPVLGLCLLALALCAARRPGAAGLAIGLAGALKLFAWPVGAVLIAHAATRGRGPALRLASGAIGLPVLALVPVLLVDPAAFVENVVRFPLGRGLIGSPAQSPLPGHLIAVALPGGRQIAAALLGLAALAIAGWLLRRPPRTAAASATISGYGLLAAMMLMPSTRFGYLLYPVALFGWAAAFRTAETGGSTPAGDGGRPAGLGDRATGDVDRGAARA